MPLLLFFVVVKVPKMKIRRERYLDVPLCATDCDDWFKACRNDYTCTDNWTLNFEWRDGVNHCRNESECRTFADVFQNASNFCERVRLFSSGFINFLTSLLICHLLFCQVWDHSWKYTSNDHPCMRIWFDGEQGNPNEAVARWKIEQSSSSSVRSAPQFLAYILPAMLLLSKC